MIANAASRPRSGEVAAAATDEAMTVAAAETGGDALAGTFLIDAHVHCHGCLTPAEFLGSAATGFAAAARGLGIATPATGWLLLAEMPNDACFDALRADAPAPPGWTLAPTDEPTSLIARERGGASIVLIAGRQVATSEGLEVLALGTCARFADGQSLAATVAAVREQGALAVVPWGFGKWLGRRGQVVARLIEAVAGDGVFLGDNGGRPASWRPPKQFAAAAARGIFVLPGSDPLPLPAQAERIARYGLVLEGAVDRRRPTAGLLRLLTGLRRQPRTFGRLQGLPACLAQQLALRWRKHARMTAACGGAPPARRAPAPRPPA